jgi:hypothetical protein
MQAPQAEKDTTKKSTQIKGNTNGFSSGHNIEPQNLKGDSNDLISRGHNTEPQVRTSGRWWICLVVFFLFMRLCFLRGIGHGIPRPIYVTLTRTRSPPAGFAPVLILQFFRFGFSGPQYACFAFVYAYIFPCPSYTSGCLKYICTFVFESVRVFPVQQLAVLPCKCNFV